ncbi:uncharacterized protein Z520_04282 [Fonsecaea multimorphosa CBS 102226]|uniref:Aldehyde dehydrogenase domain-containing protein n=1 Tax=Fonsecaea multimorphosa CBS 102226 TaxID=1442371 RepID=A0A0D2K1C8_9EURO|nr:uncharacterized protein Z520_04282 [Fonsecaea multimorphosa CBS 102226]KIX99647.1 hypothetical protein Z520_04282 [Fonsecaea multimorphosa CBS 102226]OAL26699.1 hypothetical protein AYO22_04052 [Fonsecaea multimorphosa]
MSSLVANSISSNMPSLITNGTSSDLSPHATNSISSSVSAFDSSSTIPLWLDGNEVKCSDTFDVVSPVDHQILYKCSSASEDDATRAVLAAEKAFKSWSKTKPDTRRDIFLRAADLLEQRSKELHHYSRTEMGMAEMVSKLELGLAINACRCVAGLIQVATTSSMPVVAEEDSNALLVKEPYGVVLGIAPWNIPYILGLRACLQPLAMGNTVVLKGPEHAPAVHWAIASVLHAAGLPAGCLNTIYHRPADAAKITNTLISHPAIKKINFTGSTAVGAIIASQAGKYLKPTVMELGGKASAIVCEDADVQEAAFHCSRGAFINAGQVCMSTERILVNAKIADEFRSALKVAMDELFSDKGMPTPQLMSAVPVQKNKRLISDALGKGARALYGDPGHSEASKTQMRPIILENVEPQMDIWYTESFGPTVSLILVQSDDEAVTIANDTEYGLSSAVFTRDLRRGLRIAREIETGAVHINSMTVHDEPALPHGGVKGSGWGRFNSLKGLDEWARTKAVTWKD